MHILRITGLSLLLCKQTTWLQEIYTPSNISITLRMYKIRVYLRKTETDGICLNFEK